MPLERPVGPDAMCPFSTRTTFLTPRFASAYAVVHPLIPPPMTTTAAVFDTRLLRVAMQIIWQQACPSSLLDT